MNTRRTFLKQATLAVMSSSSMDWELLAQTATTPPLVVSDARIIRVRDRKSGTTDAYLEIASESGLKGHWRGS